MYVCMYVCMYIYIYIYVCKIYMSRSLQANAGLLVCFGGLKKLKTKSLVQRKLRMINGYVPGLTEKALRKVLAPHGVPHMGCRGKCPKTFFFASSLMATSTEVRSPTHFFRHFSRHPIWGRHLLKHVFGTFVRLGLRHFCKWFGYALKSREIFLALLLTR